MSFGSKNEYQVFKGSAAIYRVSDWTAAPEGVLVGYTRPNVTVEFPTEFMIWREGVPSAEAFRDYQSIGCELKFTMGEVADPLWWELVHNGTKVTGETLDSETATVVYGGQTRSTISKYGWRLVASTRDGRVAEFHIYSGSVFSPAALSFQETDYVDQEVTVVAFLDSTRAADRNMWGYISQDYDDTTYYTITYAGNGNTSGIAPVDTNSYESGASGVIQYQGSLLKTGYTFSDWDTVALGGGTSYAPSEDISVTADVVVYAQWDEDV